jgi:hypothetical protein
VDSLISDLLGSSASDSSALPAWYWDYEHAPEVAEKSFDDAYKVPMNAGLAAASAFWAGKIHARLCLTTTSRLQIPPAGRQETHFSGARV